jgi:hypothetical protein
MLHLRGEDNGLLGQKDAKIAFAAQRELGHKSESEGPSLSGEGSHNDKKGPDS